MLGFLLAVVVQAPTMDLPHTEIRTKELLARESELQDGGTDRQWKTLRRAVESTQVQFSAWWTEIPRSETWKEHRIVDDPLSALSEECKDARNDDGKLLMPLDHQRVVVFVKQSHVVDGI